MMRGLPDANVQFDVRYAQYWTLQSGGMYTNAEGFFFIQCPGVQYTSIRGSVKTWQPYNFSTGMTTTFGEWWLPGCTDMTSPRAFQIVTGSEHARVYHNLVLTLNRSHPLFGVKRGYINVKVYPGVSGTSNYTETYWDDIEIYGDDVWGSRGVFTVAHEYGHATQAKSLGGMNGGECGSSHWLTDAINMYCAYSEGFADFFAAITREDEAAYTAPYIRPGPFPVYNRSTGQAVYDGSVSEGPVAAFLYDLIDSADDVNEGFDRVSFSGRYLAAVLRSCRIYNPLYKSFTGPTRIDHIIACMENSTDIYYPSFFPSAGALRVLIYNESADESSAGGWNPAAIRALWRHDLYRQ
jgi:hypothetical protein